MNNNYKFIRKPIKCQTIWLNTKDGLTDSSERKYFTFNHLPLIQIRNHSVLKINSVTLSGDGVGSASGHDWVIKLGNVKYNTTSYFNSDKESMPTICHLNYDQNNSIQNGSFCLELEVQDIKQLVLKIVTHDGASEHGAIKNSQPIEFAIGLVIEQYEEL
jgi:hypothetical protein